MNAVANALAHKELIPDVNLNEKEERDVKRFEEKKLQGRNLLRQRGRMFWSIRESTLVKKCGSFKYCQLPPDRTA